MLLAFLLAVVMTQAGPIGKVGHLLFGAPGWRRLSELSYSAYLYHEQVRWDKWTTQDAAF